jgi:hypothetical protein
MARFEVASEMAIVALCDASVSLPAGRDQDALVRELEPLARDGRVFYLATDDPVYMERVNKLGLVGCLPLVFLFVTLVAQRWSWLSVVLPLVAVSWLPYVILSRGRRYKAAERQASDVEQARPHYVFCVEPADREGPSGGFLRV